MNRQEFALWAAALKTYYSREEKLLPNNQALELWFDALQDIPYNVAELALKKWVSTNKWSPSIAEVRETATGIVAGEAADWGRAWQEVQAAMNRFGSYRPQEALASMDDLTRQAVERLGFTALCHSESPATDRANFRMIYEQLAERERLEKQMPRRLTVLIKEAQGRIDERERQGIRAGDYRLDDSGTAAAGNAEGRA